MSSYPEMELDEVPSSRVIRRGDVEDNGVVEFQCLESERSALPDPHVAGDHVPEWYRQLAPQMMESETGVMTTPSTGKRCGPFNESLTAGWLLRAPAELELRRRDGRVSVTSGDRFVTVLEGDDGSARDPDRESDNSRFHKPDVLVDTRWALNVPDGYGLLITYPLNRSEPTLEPMSYFHVPSGPTERQPFVELAAHLWGDSTTIRRGQPLASVVPLPLDRIPTESRVAPLSELSAVRRVQLRNDSRLSVRPSFYRKEIWYPRVGEVLRDSKETDRPPAQSHRDGGETTAADEFTMSFEQYETYDELSAEVSSKTVTHLGEDVPAVPEGEAEFLGNPEVYDHLPVPKSGTEYIQPWHRNLDAEFDAIAESPFPIQAAVLRGMSLGFVLPNEMTLNLRRDPDAQGRFRVTTDAPGDLTAATVQDDRIIGHDHPNMPMTITNVNSRWLFRTPPDTASLFLPPMNHFQSAYRAFSGIVETDRWYGFLNVPGRLQNTGEEFTLERGMPLAQIVPYGRGDGIMTGVLTHRNSTVEETDR